MKLREFVLSSGRKIFSGRDAESNDELVKEARKNDVVLHTQAAGSPFVNVGEKSGKKELKEAAIFCAKYSQDWRNSKGDVVVNKFLRKDMRKGIFAKTGSWKVKKSEKIVVKKIDILNFEKEMGKR